MLITVLTRAAVPEIPIQYQFCPKGKVVSSGWRVAHVWNAHLIQNWLDSDSTFSTCQFGKGNKQKYIQYVTPISYKYLPF